MGSRRIIPVALPSLLIFVVALAIWWQGTTDRGPIPGAEAPEAGEPLIASAGAPPPTAPRKEKVQLKRGDNLVAALGRSGVPSEASHSIAAALRKTGADLRRLKPRDLLEITWSPGGDVLSVGWEPGPWLGYIVISSEDGWTVRRIETRPDVRVEGVQGRIARSLWQAVDDAGEARGLVVDLVSIFESEFDFTADTRTGDRFRVLVEKRYAGETFVDHGRVLIAQYVNDGRVLTGVGFESSGGKFAYYDLDGRSLRKSFLKSPLEFTRITSGFTYARPHPILGGTLPHLAVDYAAPIGTPVRAVADGVVLHAGWDSGYGIAVRVRHRSGYETRYAHLSRLGPGIRAGTRVSQRQIIGHVGSTGTSTGPHLHYEVAKGGRRVNPLSEKFIPGEPIPAAERKEFLGQARALLARLEQDTPF